MKLTDDARSSIRVQDYSPKPAIDGVKVIQLRRFNDEGGSLTELGRLTEGKLEGLESFTVEQINYSEMEPGAIKAFHIHEKQTDVWYVPPGDKVLLILADVRSESATSGIKMKLVLGDYKSQLVAIPPGVAHGCKNLSTRQSRIIYFVSQKFTAVAVECDEKRLPWDFFGSKIWDTPKE